MRDPNLARRPRVQLCLVLAAASHCCDVRHKRSIQQNKNENQKHQNINEELSRIYAQLTARREVLDCGGNINVEI